MTHRSFQALLVAALLILPALSDAAPTAWAGARIIPVADPEIADGVRVSRQTR